MHSDVTRFDPAYATIERLRAALDSGRVTSEQLVQYYLQRIARFDRRGPQINAFITLNPQALPRARALDAGAALSARKPLLYGIPFVAKDNFDTQDLATSGGSIALRHSVPAANAVVVQKLLDSGAILLGKTNLSELAASHGRLGYSSAGGLTVNPYNTARDASGSSSGSAAAVAADFAPFALGTDTAGSVRCPAGVTGLVGLRPTTGLLSSKGIIPLSPTFDTPGVMTRSVRDLAIVLDTLTSTEKAGVSCYLDATAASTLLGHRLGVVTNFRGSNVQVDHVEDAALARLRAAGSSLISITLPVEFEDLWTSVLAPIGANEFKVPFERYLRSLPAGQPHNLGELIARCTTAQMTNSTSPINPLRLDALRAAQRTSIADSSICVAILRDTIPALRHSLQTMMELHRLSALGFATMACPAAPRFDCPDDRYECSKGDSYRSAYIAAAVGFPEITVPAGMSDGIPMGYSFLGKAFGECRLLGLAAGFEAGTPPVPAPRLSD